MSDTILVDFREDVAEYLRSDSYFSDITVLTEKQRQVLAEIQRKRGVVTSKAGKIGVAVVVLDPIANDEFGDAPFGPNEIIQTVRVLENPELNAGTNGTRKAALTIARRIQRVLKHYTSAGFASPMIPDNPTIIRVEIDTVPLAYDVNFRCREADNTTETKVSTPSVSPSSGAAPQTVTLSCVTAGASIYYTLDGTHPWSGNAAAVLYSAPFEVSTAANLRVGAFKTGSIASNINQAIFT